MADLNKAVGIDHYYAIGVRNGVNRFDVAYTSDEAIAVALRNALEDTWENHPKKRYKVHGFNGRELVLPHYKEAHMGQYFWISVLSPCNPMAIYDTCIAYPLRVYCSPRVSDAVAVFADHEIADKVGKRLIDSHMASTTMNGSIIDPAFYVAYSCPPISGETLNGWFKEGVL